MILKAKTPAPPTRDSHYCTCLGHLGQHDPNRNVPNCQGKEGRQYRFAILQALSCTNLANVNDPLRLVFKNSLASECYQ